uniref:Pectinesterase catalytic domain-containing protein n=1 Tax=Fagus sylvatica TaxID=28930 RepID=A0A2N9IX81_FAGSY
MLRSTDANFYRCKFSGYQDTIYYNSGQEFYRECIIEVVKGEGFTAKELTIQNTVRPAIHQAVAISVQAENVAFYRCKFSGYQDTIYYNSGQEFYCERIIEVVKGEGFTAKELTIQNTVGPAIHQAVAVSVQAENVAFYRCKFSGYQDTIYYNSGQEFYCECIIEVVKGEGFTAKELTIQNTVGPANHQAIAVFIQAENVAFYRCKFRGYQDTIYYNSGWLEWDNRGIFGSTEYVEYGNSGVGAAVQG